MTRLPQWPEGLAAYIESRRYTPFQWAHNDCALFSNGGILVMTDRDLAAEQGWNRYKTERGAARLIARVGGMRELALQAGLAEKHPGLAQRGDLTICELNGRDTFGLVAGNGSWCAPGVTCIEFRPMSEVRLAFGV